MTPLLRPSARRLFRSAATASVLPPDWTLADLWTHLGGIPLERIRMVPPPGTATEKDVIDADDHADRLCELIDGVLVEKTMGYIESFIAIEIVYLLRSFLEAHDLGIALGEAWHAQDSSAPGAHSRRVFHLLGPVSQPAASPRADSRSGPRPGHRSAFEPATRRKKCERKLHDYFTAGVRLVWYIDPRTRSAKSYTGENQFVEVAEPNPSPAARFCPGLNCRCENSSQKWSQPGPADSRNIR